MAPDPDDLDRVPYWDAQAIRMAQAIERSIVRLDLDSQGEFIAIINAILMQLESPHTVPEVVRRLGDALRALAHARGIEAGTLHRLDQRLDELLERVSTTS